MAISTCRLILASTSAYRCALLKRLYLPFEMLDPEVDETPFPKEKGSALALRLAVAKAQAGISKKPGCIVIGSDQVAILPNGSLIGKSYHFANAQNQLRTLSGQKIIFYTALAVTDGVRLFKKNVLTHCHFRTLSHAEIDCYLQTEPTYDTAGSAKVEGLGIVLMKSIRSNDPSAIIGLPLIALTDILGRFGLSPLSSLDSLNT